MKTPMHGGDANIMMISSKDGVSQLRMSVHNTCYMYTRVGEGGVRTLRAPTTEAGQTLAWRAWSSRTCMRACAR